MRLTPGALLLRFHQTFGHGLTVAWFRDVIRPRILSTYPVRQTDDRCCEIHILTSKQDWLNAVWTLKSFYRFSGRRYRLCIHEDGSLSRSEIDTMRGQFPNARIVTRLDADIRLSRTLANFPRCRALRASNPLAMKLFDFIEFLEGERMALFDSDLLFFDEPSTYLSRVEDANYKLNTFNADLGTRYTLDVDHPKFALREPVQRRLNSGFGLVHSRSLPPAWIEEFLGLPNIHDGNPWLIEQTLIALCSSRYGVELLPEEYSVRLDEGIGDRPMRHYVGKIRHLMYGEGMRRLSQLGLVNNGAGGQQC